MRITINKTFYMFITIYTICITISGCSSISPIINNTDVIIGNKQDQNTNLTISNQNLLSGKKYHSKINDTKIESGTSELTVINKFHKQCQIHFLKTFPFPTYTGRAFFTGIDQKIKKEKKIVSSSIPTPYNIARYTTNVQNAIKIAISFYPYQHIGDFVPFIANITITQNNQKKKFFTKVTYFDFNKNKSKLYLLNYVFIGNNTRELKSRIYDINNDKLITLPTINSGAFLTTRNDKIYDTYQSGTSIKDREISAGMPGAMIGPYWSDDKLIVPYMEKTYKRDKQYASYLIIYDNTGKQQANLEFVCKDINQLFSYGGVSGPTIPQQHIQGINSPSDRIDSPIRYNQTSFTMSGKRGYIKGIKKPVKILK